MQILSVSAITDDGAKFPIHSCEAEVEHDNKTYIAEVIARDSPLTGTFIVDVLDIYPATLEDSTKDFQKISDKIYEALKDGELTQSFESLL